MTGKTDAKGKESKQPFTGSVRQRVDITSTPEPKKPVSLSNKFVDGLDEGDGPIEVLPGQRRLADVHQHAPHRIAGSIQHRRLSTVGRQRQALARELLRPPTPLVGFYSHCVYSKPSRSRIRSRASFIRRFTVDTETACNFAISL